MVKFNPETLNNSEINYLHNLYEQVVMHLYPAARRNYDAAVAIMERAIDALQRVDAPSEQPLPSATVEAKPAPHASYTVVLREGGAEEHLRVRKRRHEPAFDDRDAPYEM